MAYKDPESRKAYREANKEKIREQNKAWYKKNKAKEDERIKFWSQSPAGKKSHTIASWKYQGIIHDDYDALYDSYLEATHCNACKSEFKNSFDRNADHNHDTGLFRQFLCRDCNRNDRWLKR
jgi:hypothetical protein